MKNKPKGSILVYDIETDSDDINTAKLKFFGYYSYLNGKEETIFVKDNCSAEKVRNILDNHQILVGYNNKRFDNPILERTLGVDLRFKINVDMWEILAPRKVKGEKTGMFFGKGRGNVIKGLKLKSYKLDSVVKALNLGEKIDNPLVYKYLKKDIISEEERKLIEEYLERDVVITKKLFEFLYNYFFDFQFFVGEKDRKNMTWFTSSIASFAYKAICFAVGLKEEYGNGVGEVFKGAIVFEPKKEKVEGRILCYDYNSLYPHIYMMANLFSYNCSCCSLEEKYKGKGPLKLKGSYCSKNMGKIEKQIKEWYLLRKKYKKEKNPREYTLKLILNSLYGASSNPVFKSIYKRETAEDCTYIARTIISYTKKMFEKAGYEVLNGDSVSKNMKVLLPDMTSLSVEEYWNEYAFNKQTINGKEVADCFKAILSCNDDYENVFVTPKKIIRHKVKKKMFRLFLTNSEFLEITEDHSLITIEPETGKLIPVKPKKLKFLLLKKDYSFSEKKILKIEEYLIDDYVYDFSIDKYERFYANNVLVHNTDSNYILDKFDDKKRLETTKNIIVSDIKKWFPFPQETFDMGVDARIKVMFFFKNPDGTFKKKNYIYITENNEIVIKGLPIIKSNATKLATTIYEKYLKNEIIKKLDCKFSLGYLKQLIYFELENNPMLASQTYRIKRYDSYNAKTSLNAQISKYIEEKFSEEEKPDTIDLIPNYKVNLGKKINYKERKKGYCTFEEYKKFNLRVTDIDISKCLSELEPFTKKEQADLGGW